MNWFVKLRIISFIKVLVSTFIEFLYLSVEQYQAMLFKVSVIHYVFFLHHLGWWLKLPCDGAILTLFNRVYRSPYVFVNLLHGILQVTILLRTNYDRQLLLFSLTNLLYSLAYLFVDFKYWFFILGWKMLGRWRIWWLRNSFFWTLTLNRGSWHLIRI